MQMEILSDCVGSSFRWSTATSFDTHRSDIHAYMKRRVLTVSLKECTRKTTPIRFTCILHTKQRCVPRLTRWVWRHNEAPRVSPDAYAKKINIAPHWAGFYNQYSHDTLLGEFWIRKKTQSSVRVHHVLLEERRNHQESPYWCIENGNVRSIWWKQKYRDSIDGYTECMQTSYPIW